MRFAAAALMAGLVFLAGSLSGFGSSSVSPRNVPQAIRLSGTTAQDPPPQTPDLQAAPAATGVPAPAVTVGHNVVPVHLPAAPLAAAASPNHGSGSPGASPEPASPPQQPAASLFTL